MAKSTPLTEADLTTASDVAFKFKMNGKWTQLLSFVKPIPEKGLFYFKPETDNLSTLEVHQIQIYLVAPETLATGKKFIHCKFYGEWEKAPHECGKDCPLGV